MGWGGGKASNGLGVRAEEQVGDTAQVTFQICVIVHWELTPIPWLTSSQLTKVKAKRGLALAKKETFSQHLFPCHEGVVCWLSEGARAEKDPRLAMAALSPSYGDSPASVLFHKLTMFPWRDFPNS